MMPQTFENNVATADDERGSGRVTHLITLIHRITGHEVAIAVQTATEAFSDVMREIAHQRVMRGLKGYEVFEFLLISEPF